MLGQAPACHCFALHFSSKIITRCSFARKRLPLSQLWGYCCEKLSLK